MKRQNIKDDLFSLVPSPKYSYGLVKDKTKNNDFQTEY
jgi:hypothetical protein